MASPLRALVQQPLAAIVCAGLAGCCFGAPVSLPSTPPPPSVAVEATVVDVDASELAARCTGAACPLLAEFATGAPFEPCPLTMAAWLGVIHPTGHGGADRAVPFFLQARLTPGGCEASARVLVTESPAEEADVEAVLAALRVGAALPPSAAVDYARTAAPPTGYHRLARTTGTSFAIASRQQFFREAGGRLLIVQVASAGLVEYTEVGLAAPLVVGELWALPRE